MNGERLGDVFVADGDDEEHREVYARFGLAYYLAECVHRGLVSVFAYLPYDTPTVARPWVEERYQKASAMTLGELATQTKCWLPAKVQGQLDWAVERRNHLAHGFWYERTHEMLRGNGRRDLVTFLRDTADRLGELNREVDALVQTHLEKLGVTPELYQQVAMEARGYPPDPPIDRRVPRTDERVEVVEAWLVGDGPLKGLVLRDRDGLGWQLGETGLGWSFKDGPGAGWKVYANLQRHLPAAIVARPKGAQPWDYKLHLSTGPLLVVLRGSDGILRFSVRTTQRTGRT